MPDWLIETLNALPAVLLMIGVGLPWALVVLPRQDWADRVMVACLTLGFGPALVTLWMFILGTIGQDATPNAGDSPNPMQTRAVALVGGENLLRPELILMGIIPIMLLGGALAWHKWRTTTPQSKHSQPLAPDEKVLIALIVVATIIRGLITTWVGFGAWDELWVYGYQGRIYTLLGFIPSDIGYYPQFLPLQYAYAQIMSAGEIADHAARVVLPFLQVGSILAAYVLGARLFNRRTGIFAAALWALYPHFGYWSRVGDLEIVLTFSFTASAAFFLMAWLNHNRRYAFIAGLFLGIAMWTKPTAGAFIWAVILLVVVEFIRVRGDWRAWLPRFQLAVITGVACIPLGALWYVRNILIGHDPIVMPPSYWNDLATRGGHLFGWYLLGLSLLILYLFTQHYRPNWRNVLLGSSLIALAVIRTILHPGRMSLLESALLILGVVILTFVILDYAFAHVDSKLLGKIGWSQLIVLPYFVTWFYSYSYHYRLSFPIVPLMILPTAALLAHWLKPDWIATWRFPRRLMYATAVVLLALPGIAVSVYDDALGWDWLWTIPPEGDYSQAALLGVVDHLQTYIDTHDQPPVVIAPGMQTLPFFFPLLDIRTTDTPMETRQLHGATHFIYGTVETPYQYRLAGIEPDFPGERLPYWSQMFASLYRENVAEPFVVFEDPAFSYTIFELHPQDRFSPPALMPQVQFEDEIIFGGFARFIGYSYSDTLLVYNPDHIDLHMVFEVLAPVPDDYFMFVHLVHKDDPNTRLGGADGPVRYSYRTPVYYSTRFWEVGEYVIDRRGFWYDPMGQWGDDDFRIRIGFYSQTDGHRAPLTINGEPAGDAFTLPTAFSVPMPPR
ncbi:MAG: hypothetical protein CUN56_11005 [Phototrophicales bacterium]|nr:MAG: hypothetical protein CUN56_11005 [Phototrophicales bacterium]RMG74748.1 MAG: hypothetical protein D6711_08100 [Chloroflexota bacterium]